MRKTLLYLLLCALFLMSATLSRAEDDADTYMDSLYETGLPLVRIETVDAEWPTFNTVTHPDGMMGTTITDATKVPGRIRVYDASGSVVYDSGSYVDNHSGMTVRVRGNTSALSNPQPYKVKLQKKADLLCRGDKRFKDKNWLLLRQRDLTLMVGMKVGELMEQPWTPQYQYVNLLFNGDYLGIYALVESVRRNPACRIDVDDTGYVFEMDAYWWNTDVCIPSSLVPVLGYTFKYPDEEDITQSQLDDFGQYLQQVEASIRTSGYQDYIDVPSFANWLLSRDILGILDGGGSNMFFTKHDDTNDSKLMMGPLWDFDSAMCMEDNWDAVHDNPFWDMLFLHSDRTFFDAYYDRWLEVRESVVPDLLRFLDDFAASDYGMALNNSIALHNSRWQGDAPEFTDVPSLVVAARAYFERRATWLDATLENINRLRGMYEKQDTDDNTIYRLDGTKATPDNTYSLPRGIYVVGRRKFITY